MQSDPPSEALCEPPVVVQEQGGGAGAIGSPEHTLQVLLRTTPCPSTPMCGLGGGGELG